MTFAVQNPCHKYDWIEVWLEYKHSQLLLTEIISLRLVTLHVKPGSEYDAKPSVVSVVLW